ncbi:MAG TPA: 50S ribosomal protein L29 [Candidatus Paceibacterota bacterium]|jgi:ribosomal protein L29
MAKKTSFKDTSAEDIAKLLVEKREELRTLRFEATGGRAKDPSARKKVRKDIARLLTEKTAKEKAA